MSRYRESKAVPELVCSWGQPQKHKVSNFSTLRNLLYILGFVYMFGMYTQKKIKQVFWTGKVKRGASLNLSSASDPKLVLMKRPAKFLFCFCMSNLSRTTNTLCHRKRSYDSLNLLLLLKPCYYKRATISYLHRAILSKLHGEYIVCESLHLKLPWTSVKLQKGWLRIIPIWLGKEASKAGTAMGITPFAFELPEPELHCNNLLLPFFLSCSALF